MFRNASHKNGIRGAVGAATLAASLLGGIAANAPQTGAAASAETAVQPSPAGVMSYGDTMDTSKRLVDNICNQLDITCMVRADNQLEPFGADTRPVMATGLYGTALITSMSVAQEYSDSTLSAPMPGYGASLQLNSEMFVQNGGTRYFYWVQDVARFNTAANTVSFVSNVWPEGINSAANPRNGTNYELQNMAGGNGIVISNDASAGKPYYIYTAGSIPYSLPLRITLLERIENGATYLGYQLGSSAPVMFDQLAITIPHSDQEFFTSGSKSTPDYMFGNASANLVFAGLGGGSQASFSSMGASLYLYHQTSRGLAPYTEVQAADNSTTGEGSTDLQSSIAKDGTISVGIGDPDSLWYKYDYSSQALAALLRA